MHKCSYSKIKREVNDFIEDIIERFEEGKRRTKQIPKKQSILKTKKRKLKK